MPVTLQQPECGIIQTGDKRVRQITAIFVSRPILELQHTFLRHSLPHNRGLASQKATAFVSAPFGHIIKSFVHI